MSAVPSWNDSSLWSLFGLESLAEHGLDAYLQEIAQQCALIFNASGSSIFLEGDSPGRFEVRGRSGHQSTVPAGAAITLGDGVAGQVAATGSPRLLGLLHDEPKLADLRSLSANKIKSSMVVPITEPQGAVIGVLNLSRGFSESAFQFEELEQATALGTHVGLAVANARLLESLRQNVIEAQVAREKLQAVLDAVGSAVIVFDENRQTIEMNAAAEEYVSGEGRSWDESSGVTPVLSCAVAQVIDAKDPGSVRAHDQESDRSWVVQGVPVGSGGCVVTVLEVTEFERAQKEADRLARLAEIGQMSATIAHEVRNPLTGIRSAAQMIRQNPEMGKEFLGIIEEEAIRLDRLCEGFLSLARPINLQRSDGNLGESVSRSVSLLQSIYDEEGVTLIAELGSCPNMNLDFDTVEQVVHNLLLNALQACEPGGTVRASVAGGALVVEDDGVGMDDEVVANMFTPFFTTKSNGTGLGMSNVRRIVEAHGGDIDVNSEPERGTNIRVVFDRSQI